MSHDVSGMPWVKLPNGCRSANFLLLRNCLTRRQVTWLGFQQYSAQRSRNSICVRRVQSICCSVRVPRAALKPKVPSVEWFHRSHGQNSKEQHALLSWLVLLANVTCFHCISDVIRDTKIPGQNTVSRALSRVFSSPKCPA